METAVEFVTVDQFLQILARSGLLPGAEIKALPARQPAADCRALAQELVRKEKLTSYQAGMLSRGRVKGLMLGSYVILDKIGEGGMGVVFRARARGSADIVALKVLPPALGKEPEILQRFQREVRAAQSLQHPHIVGALDAGEDKGVHFLVMEYMAGPDLGRLVREQGPQPVDQALAWILQAARGLAHAHQAGMIHRDIKPSNLLLSKPLEQASPGLVKILDLGLVRFERSDSATDEKARSLTLPGTMLGTCDYVAPEQAVNSKNADQRADIYSLGCTLYYLLTGRTLYRGQTVMEKLVAHREDPIPSLRAVRPEVPELLDGVYQCMVAKQLDERFQSMAEVIAALEDCQNATGPERPREKSRKRRRWLLAVAGMLLMLSVGLGAYFLAAPIPEPVASTETSEADVEPDPVVDHAPVPFDRTFVDRVRTLPAVQQVDEVLKQLQVRNKVGKAYPKSIDKKIDDGVVTEIRFTGDHVADLSPIRALTGLRVLVCNVTAKGKTSRLASLAPLQELRLTHLEIANTQIADLKPLAGMRLTILDCSGTKVEDLSPLRDMPLVSVHCERTLVHSLTPIAGPTLRDLWADTRPLRESVGALRTCPSLVKINNKTASSVLANVSAKP